MPFTEPVATAVLLVVFGLLLGICVVLGRWFERLGVPIALLSLVLGMLAGSEGIGGVAFADYGLAYRLGTAALVLILFDGGLNTPLVAWRKAIAPASILATVGVALTAGLCALGARLLGLPWPVALLVGAVVSSTDAAAVFSILRGGGIRLRERLGLTLELESGGNDPMAVILTAAVTASLLGEGPTGWQLAWSVPLQLVIGLLVGLATGTLARAIVSRVRLTTAGLFPAFTVGLAFFAYGGATVVQGSGFLAVYVAALVFGNGPLPYHQGLRRIHDALAWLSQVSMFMMLGLLVFPYDLVPKIGIGLGLAAFLTVVARPVAVFLCVLPFRFPRRELVYMSWVGLRGSVPIILATYPVLRGAPYAMDAFNVVFFIVVINALVPGATVRWLARKLGLERVEPPAPPAALEIHSMGRLEGEVLWFYIDPAVAVCDVPLSEIYFPDGAAAILVVRGDSLVAPRGSTTLAAGDHVYVCCRAEHRAEIELLFGRAQ
ncbi:MAG TPA: potassium/proton antiporter [Thermoanaerobaculia bacterium]|nr:potassium/proton antiporter [Thermoanaerobaculia bacterium]